MKALVTGGTGFLGRQLVRELARRGHPVTALVRPAASTAALPADVRVVRGDVTEPETLHAAVAGQEVVFHLAAMVGGRQGGWEAHEAVGVCGTRNVLDAAAAADVPRFVHLSSLVVHGPHPAGELLTERIGYDTDVRPWDHYARQKILSEKLVWTAHERGRVLASTIRPPTVLGPGDPNLVGVIRAIMSSPLGDVARDGCNHMPVVVAEELVAGVADVAATEATIGKAYYLSGRDPITKDTLLGWFREFGLRPLERRAGVGLAVQAVAAAARCTAWLPGASTHRDRLIVRLEAHARRRAQHDCVVDCSRAAADSGWSGSADCRDAIRRTMEWASRS
jgi:nucleoside-diphosphate-sugar epimerase